MRRDEVKAATREKVLAVAARSLRRHGIAGTGVAAVMARAGLTHGGFYAHFRSKNALAAAAIASGFLESRRRTMDRLAALPAADAIDGWIDIYLGTRHRDEADRGCLLPALAAEAARGDADVRAAVATGFEALSARLEAWLDVGTARDAAALARSLLAEAVGTLMIARVLGATAASDTLLASARESLRARARSAA